MKEYLSFDDVSLVPRHSFVNSRFHEDIDLSTQILGGSVLDIPLISSPMDTVSGPEMCVAMAKKGGMGILHKYLSYDQFCRAIDYMVQQLVRPNRFAFAVGIDDKYLERIDYAITNYGHQQVCLDIANGYLQKALDYLEKIHLRYGANITTIAGNVCTIDGVKALSDMGVSAIRIGLGNGSLCTTRRVTGHGLPQFTVLQDCCEWARDNSPETFLISDGGCREAGDIVKALALGAHAVMCGKLFASTKESPGILWSGNYFVIPYMGESPSIPDSTLYKIYRGQSSKSVQIDLGRPHVASEGEETRLPYKGSVNLVIDELMGGLRSGLSYSNAFNLEELYHNAEFARVSHAGHQEGLPHALNR